MPETEHKNPHDPLENLDLPPQKESILRPWETVESARTEAKEWADKVKRDYESSQEIEESKVIANTLDLSEYKISDRLKNFLTLAIEKKDFEVRSIPWRPELLALSLDWKNLDFILTKNGNKYFYPRFIRHGLTKDWINIGLEKAYWAKEIDENGYYILYLDNRKIATFSKEYFLIMMKVIDAFTKMYEVLKKDQKLRHSENRQ